MTGLTVEQRVARLEDHREICNLQGRYNHYLQTGLLKEKVGELFAFGHPDVKAEMCDSGMWHGADGIVKLFTHMGKKYSMPGELMLHMLVTPVVEVSDDGTRARGMWNSFGTNTYLDEFGTLVAMWQAGKYDNVFVKVDGSWKFLEFKWYVIFRTPFHEGWVKRPIVEGLHEEGFPAVSPFHTPYSPTAPHNVFLPAPPEPGTVRGGLE